MCRCLAALVGDANHSRRRKFNLCVAFPVHAHHGQPLSANATSIPLREPEKALDKGQSRVGARGGALRAPGQGKAEGRASLTLLQMGIPTWCYFQRPCLPLPALERGPAVESKRLLGRCWCGACLCVVGASSGRRASEVLASFRVSERGRVFEGKKKAIPWVVPQHNPPHPALLKPSTSNTYALLTRVAKDKRIADRLYRWQQRAAIASSSQQQLPRLSPFLPLLGLGRALHAVTPPSTPHKHTQPPS